MPVNVCFKALAMHPIDRNSLNYTHILTQHNVKVGFKAATLQVRSMAWYILPDL